MIYSISGNFRDNQIFFLFVNKLSAEIISCIIFYKKLFELQKMTDANLKCHRYSILSVLTFVWPAKKTTGYTVLPRSGFFQIWVYQHWVIYTCLILDHFYVINQHGHIVPVPGLQPLPSVLPEVPHGVGRVVTPGLGHIVLPLGEETAGSSHCHVQKQMEL